MAIIGAGMSGVLMGVKLREAGFDDFAIYEKADAVGGTWRDNRYPGLACDIPSRYYSYSFAPNPAWSRVFSSGSEILSYLEGIVRRYRLAPHIRLGQEVEDARYVDRAWQVRTGDSTTEFDFVVSACGILHHPRTPSIDGLEDFAGTSFHTARWPADLDLAGKRVGIIGNGSTGVQVIGSIAKEVGSLAVFQRTPHWIFPMPNPRYGPLGRFLVGRRPRLSKLAYRGYQELYERILTRGMVEDGWQRSFVSWVSRQHMRVVRDPELRRRLTPSYPPMCKRLIVSTRFLPAMNRDNVELVSEPILRAESHGLRTQDSRLHELDVLILATGFEAQAFMRPMALTGEDGVELAELWREDPHAYNTVALPGFPNLFVLVGPHSPYGHQSVVMIAETQVDYAMEWISMWAAGSVDRMAPTIEATDRFNAEVADALGDTIWTSGCQSWYLDSKGQPALWPWRASRHRELLRTPTLADFDVTASRDIGGDTTAEAVLADQGRLEEQRR